MAASVAMLVVTAYSAKTQYDTQKEIRKQAEAELARQRDALASLQKEPPPTMPTPDDAAVKRASITELAKRRGRTRTILTDPVSDTLG